MFGTLPAHDDQEAPPSTTPASAARATRARASKALPVSAVVRELEVRLNKIVKLVERMKRLLKQRGARTVGLSKRWQIEV